MTRPILKQAEQWPQRVAMAWYHVSPNDLPDGTELVPRHPSSMYQEMYRHNPGRGDYVWVTDTPEHAHEWSSVIAEDTGVRPKFMYEVEPHDEPQVFDEEYPDDEWTTSGATILRKVPFPEGPNRFDWEGMPG